MADATGHIRVETIIDDSLKSGLKGVSDSIFLVSARINGLNALTRNLTNTNYAVSQSLRALSSAQTGTAKSARELISNQIALANYLKQVRVEAGAASGALSAHQQTLSRTSNEYRQAGAEIAFINQKLMQLNSTQKVVDRTMRANSLQALSKQYNKQATELSYVGQRLTMGLTLPLTMLGRLGFSSLKKLDQEIIRTRKLLDDTATSTNDLEKTMKVLSDRLDSISYKWGVSRELLQGLAGDFAELGISDPKTLGNLVQITNEIEKLGNVDITDAGKLTQSIYQNLLRIRRLQGMSVTDPLALQQITQEVRGAIALFNYAENKTSLSLKNIADAFPEVSGAATSFGLNMATTAALLVPMVSAGFQVGASANSIKVSLQKLVLPTRDTRNLIKALRQELGPNFKMSADIGEKGLQNLIDGYIELEKSAYKTQGTMQLFGKAFGVRQGPRMEVAIQQMAAFQKQLNNAASSEAMLMSSLEKSINAQLRKNGLEEVSLKNIKDIQELNQASTERDKKNNLLYSDRAQIIQNIQRQESKQIQTQDKLKKAMQDISTESGKILIGSAYGQAETGKTMEEELKRSEQALNVQAGRVRESVKSIARDFTVAFGEILKVVSPILIKIAKSIREMSPGFKKAIGFAALFLVAIGPIIRIFSLFKQTQSLATLGLAKGLVLGRTKAQELNVQLLKTSDTLLRMGKRGKVTQLGDKIVFEGRAKDFRKAETLMGLESKYDESDKSRSSRRTGKEILRLKKDLGIINRGNLAPVNAAGLFPGTIDALGLNPFTKATASVTSNLAPDIQAKLDEHLAKMAAKRAATATTAGLTVVGQPLPVVGKSPASQSISQGIGQALGKIIAILQAIKNCACSGKNMLTAKPQSTPSGNLTGSPNAPPVGLIKPTGGTGAPNKGVAASAVGPMYGPSRPRQIQYDDGVLKAGTQQNVRVQVLQPLFANLENLKKKQVNLVADVKQEVQTVSAVIAQVTEQVSTVVKKSTKKVKSTSVKTPTAPIFPTGLTPFSAPVEAKVERVIPSAAALPAAGYEKLFAGMQTGIKTAIKPKLLSPRPSRAGSGEAFDEASFRRKAFEDSKAWFRKSTGANYVEGMGKPTSPSWGRRSFSDAMRAARMSRAGRGLIPSIGTGDGEFSVRSKESIKKAKEATKAAGLQALRESRTVPEGEIDTSPRILTATEIDDARKVQEAQRSGKPLSQKQIDLQNKVNARIQRDAQDLAKRREAAALQQQKREAAQRGEGLLGGERLRGRRGQPSLSMPISERPVANMKKVGDAAKTATESVKKAESIAKETAKKFELTKDKLIATFRALGVPVPQDLLNAADFSVEIQSKTRDKIVNTLKQKLDFSQLYKRGGIKSLLGATQKSPVDKVISDAINEGIIPRGRSIKVKPDAERSRRQVQRRRGVFTAATRKILSEYGPEDPSRPARLRNIERRFGGFGDFARGLGSTEFSRAQDAVAEENAKRRQANEEKTRAYKEQQFQQVITPFGKIRTKLSKPRSAKLRPEFETQQQAREFAVRNRSKYTGLVYPTINGSEQLLRSRKTALIVGTKEEEAQKKAKREQQRAIRDEKIRAAREGIPAARERATAERLAQQTGSETYRSKPQNKPVSIIQSTAGTVLEEIQRPKVPRPTVPRIQVPSPLFPELGVMRYSQEEAVAVDELRKEKEAGRLSAAARKKQKETAGLLIKPVKKVVPVTPAPDISESKRPKSLSAGIQSGATTLGNINSQLTASLQIPTNVLDQFYQTLKIQGKGLAEVASNAGLQAADDLALLKQELSKIGLTIEQAISKPTESLKQLQTAKFAKGGDIQAMFQRLVMYTRDVAEKGVQGAFDLTKERLDKARAKGAGATPTASTVGAVPTSTTAIPTSGKPLTAGMTNPEIKVVAQQLASRIRQGEKLEIDFYAEKVKLVEYLSRTFNVEGRGKGKQDVIIPKLIKAINKFQEALGGVVKEEVVSLNTAGAAIEATSPKTPVLVNNVIAEVKQLDNAVTRHLQNMGSVVNTATAGVSVSIRKSVRKPAEVLNVARPMLALNAGQPSRRAVAEAKARAAAVGVVGTGTIPLAPSVSRVTSIPSPAGFAPQIAKFNIKASQVARSLASINPRRILESIAPASVATQRAGAMIGRSRPGIADYRLPGRVSTFDPSSVLKQIKTISSELKPKSISDIPIPKRPRLGREIRRPMTELTPEQYAPTTKVKLAGRMLGTAGNIAFNPVKQATLLGGAIASVAKKISPARFASQNVYTPRDYVGEARSATFAKIAQANIQKTSRQLRIAEKDARVIAKEARATDRPARVSRMSAQSLLPSQFRQSLNPTIDALKAIGKIYGKPLKSALSSQMSRVASTPAGERLRSINASMGGTTRLKTARNAAILGTGMLASMPITAPAAMLPLAAAPMVGAVKLGKKIMKSDKTQDFLQNTQVGQNVQKSFEVIANTIKSGGVLVKQAGESIRGSVTPVWNSTKQVGVAIGQAVTHPVNAIKDAGVKILGSFKNLKDAAVKGSQNLVSSTAGMVKTKFASGKERLVGGAVSYNTELGTVTKTGGLLRADRTLDQATGQVTKGRGFFSKGIAGAASGAKRGITGAIGTGGGLAQGALSMAVPPQFQFLLQMFPKLIAFAQRFVKAFSLITIVVLAVVGVFKFLQSTFSQWGQYAEGFMANFKAAWTALSGIFTTIKTAISDFFKSFFNGGEKSSSSMADIGKKVLRVSEIVRDFALKFTKFFNGTIKPAIYSFLSSLKLVIDGAIKLFGGIFNVIKGIVQKFQGQGNEAGKSFDKGFDMIKTGAFKLFKGVLKALSPFLILLIKAFEKVIVFVVNIFEKVWILIIKAISLVIRGIINLFFMIPKAIIIVVQQILNVWKDMQTAFIKIVAEMLKLGVSLLFNLPKIIIDLVKKIVNIFAYIVIGWGSILDKMSEVFLEWTNKILDYAKDQDGLLGAFFDVTGITAITKGLKVVTGLVGKGVSAIGSVYEIAGKTVKTISDKVFGGIGDGLDELKNKSISGIDVVSNILIKGASAVAGVGQVFYRVVQEANNGIISLVDTATGKIIETIGSASDLVGFLSEGLIGWIKKITLGDDIGRSLGDDFKGKVKDKVDDALTNLDPESAISAGEDIANAISDGLKTLKTNFFDKVVDNLGKSLEKQKNKITDALTLQKENQLKIFDDQIAAIDALAAAEEKLTATIEFENQKREAEAERALQKKSYEKQRALAIYEGRIDDARTLDQEEVKNRRDAEKSLKDLEANRTKTLQSENRDTAKTIIAAQKSKAAEAFDKDIKAFEEFAAEVLAKGTFTQDELKSQFEEISAKATTMSAEMRTSFETFYTAIPNIISANTDTTAGMFGEDMQKLVDVAKSKFGIEADLTDPGTILGATAAMLSGSATLFRESMPAVIAEYSDGVDGLTEINRNFADPTNESSPGKLFEKAISDANEALKREYIKMQTSATSAFAAIVKGINEELNKLAIDAALDAAIEKLQGLKNKKPESTPSADTGASTDAGAGTGAGTGTGATPGFGPVLGSINAERNVTAPVAPTRSPAQNLSQVSFNTQAGKDGFIGLGNKAAYVSNIKKALNFYGYSTNTSDTLGDDAVRGIAKFQSQNNISPPDGRVRVNTAKALGLFGTDGVQKRYYGGAIKRMMGGPVGVYGAGGDVPGFMAQGVPALLHGGEYVVNAKAVQNLGSGFLGYLNSLKYGIPKFNVPTPSMPNININQNINVNGGNSETLNNYNFYVDNFIGEDKWFEGMMNEYNVKVVPNKQKSAGLESRVIRSYNGINKGI